MAQTVPAWLLAAALVANLVLGVAVCTMANAWGAGLPWWAWPLAMGVGILAALAVLVRALQRLGGITGDVLGALVEASTVGLLLGLAMI